jgi:hypothetical protein
VWCVPIGLDLQQDAEEVRQHHEAWRWRRARLAR